MFKIVKLRGAWVAQSVKRPTSAQVTISRSVSSSPASGSALLEILSLPFSPSLPHSHVCKRALSHFLSQKLNKSTLKWKEQGRLGGSVG